MSTVKFEIELPATFEIESRDQKVAIHADKFTPAIIARAAFHGIKQKIGDSAASASDPKVWTEDESEMPETSAKLAATVRMMTACRDRLYDGDWGAERGSSSPDPLAKLRKYIRATVRNAKVKDGGKIKDSDAYKSAEDKSAFIDDTFDALAESVRKGIITKAQRAYDDEHGLEVDIDL